MKIDTSIWDNPARLRERMYNTATMVASITAVNGFYVASQKNWFLLSLNVIFFLSVIPLFISKAKWGKNPPKRNGDE